MQKSDFHEPPQPPWRMGFTEEAYYPNCICYELMSQIGTMWAATYHLRYWYATLDGAHRARWETAQDHVPLPTAFFNPGRRKRANQRHMALIKVLDSIRKHVLWYCDHSDYIHRSGIAQVDTATWSLTLEGVKEIRTTMPYRLEGV